ncbi:hypothetical protein [Halarcobacter sp.]|uniref:hypothetical protein n=1 Tax=Halarcobacter sp. TaxID=2321133 RepID=UPI0029F5BC52|nr:hypothetical protein [Halarcobacter sp.]
MNLINSNTLQTIDGLSNAQSSQNIETISSSDYLSTALFSNQFKVEDLNEIAKEQDNLNEDLTTEAIQLERQRTSSIQNSANIMKALLDS